MRGCGSLWGGQRVLLVVPGRGVSLLGCLVISMFMFIKQCER